MTKMMLVGLGDLGGVLLEYLVTNPELSFLIADVDEDRATARVNLARLGAVARDLDPEIEVTRLDLNNVEDTASKIAEHNPQIILTAATLQTWWLPDKLPERESRRIKSAGYGVWLPVHFALTLKLMQAVKEANFGGMVLTAPYPDVANAILGKLKLEPMCGVGNIDEMVPKVRWLVSQRLSVPIGDVKVLLVAHHALQRFTLNRTAVESASTPPFYLRVEVEGDDVTEEVHARELLFSALPIPPGPVSHLLTAASTSRLLEALVSEEGRNLHVPGPYGAPGGYPVNVARTGVRLVDIPGLSREEAIELNERSHWYDGIERIAEDGSVHYTQQAVETMRETIGYDCPELRPEEVSDRSKELIQRFREYARRHEVSL